MKKIMVVNGVLAIIIILAMGALQGCGDDEQTRSEPATVSEEEVKEEVKEAYDTTKAYTEDQMQAFSEKTETKLAEYEEKINQLQEDAEKLEGDAKAEAEEQLAALRQKRDEIAEKLKELGSSSASAWEQIKTGIDSAMEDLAKAHSKASAEFGDSQKQ